MWHAMFLICSNLSIGVCFFTPGIFSSYIVCPHPSHHCYCPCPYVATSSTSCHSGNYGSDLCNQHSINITTELGHHSAGKRPSTQGELWSFDWGRDYRKLKLDTKCPRIIGTPCKSSYLLVKLLHHTLKNESGNGYLKNKFLLLGQ